MCFGETPTGQKDTAYTPNPDVTAGAQSNINFAQNLQSAGFQPYGGQMVANFSPQQSESFGMADTIGSSPDLGTATNYINNYATAPASSVNASTIASNMSPYMNQYVQQALAPQLENLQQQFAGQNKQAQSEATMAGAFGNDSQDALYRSNLTNQQDIAQTGLVGQAYTNAFNTAIGAGAQDVANSLNAQTTNANLKEQANSRMLAGAQGLEGVIGTQGNVANLVNQMGQQQTAQSQAQLNAPYQQYLMAQQYPFLTTELLNQTVGTGAQAMPASSTQTSYAPNNSGYALAGAALPMLFAAEGGTIPAGQPTMVGEQGSEAMVPTAGMTPNVQLPPLPSMSSISAPQLPQIGGQQQQAQQQQQQQNSQNPMNNFYSQLGSVIGGGLNSAFSGGGDTGATADPLAGGGSPPTMGATSDFSSFGMAGFAEGGEPPVGKASIVGERGPEVIVPNQPMTVIPHEALMKAAQRYKNKAPSTKPPTDQLERQFGVAA